jgi:hypothetical protein
LLMSVAPWVFLTKYTELLGFRTLSIVRNPSNSVCYTPSSEPSRICITLYFVSYFLLLLSTYSC